MNQHNGILRRTFIAGVAAGVGLLAARGTAAGQAMQKIRVGLIPTDFAGEPWYAKDMGFFAKHGLDAEISEMSNGSVIASAVAGGSLDVGFSNIPSIAIAHGKGLPFIYLAGANLYDAAGPTIGQLVVPRASPIKIAKDFEGKTISVGGINNITHLGLKAWLDANGADSEKVKYLELPVQTTIAALLGGRVDASIVDVGIYPAIGHPNSTDPVRLVADTFNAVAKQFLSGGWFTTKEWVLKNSPVAKNFVAAMTDAAAWANTRKNRGASAAIIAKYIKSSTAAEINGTTRVTYATTLTPTLIQPMIDLVAKYKVISASFPAAEIIAPAV